MTPIMTPTRWRQVNEIFAEAAEYDAQQRKEFLVAACAGDESLRLAVEKMLQDDESTDNFLEISPVRQFIEASSSHNLVGQSIGHYHILVELGAGGMGEVYQALDTKLEREVAIKILPRIHTIDASRVQRFMREARAASSLNHPNIITIHEVGQQENVHYIVTELITGQTLRQLMSESRLKLSQALDLAMQIASALTAAHGAGIIHRDIKPENIMVRPDGLVKVLDFGVAKLTERNGEMANGRRGEDAPPLAPSPRRPAADSTELGTVLGTARYMSPEQARGLAVDARSDIFSLGIVLYEMIAGQTPFQGVTNTDVIIAIVEREPPPLTKYLAVVPLELQRILSKMLGKNCEERYQTSDELLTELKNLRRQIELDPQPGKHESLPLQTNQPTAKITSSRTISSAEYIVTNIRQHKRTFSLAFVAVLVLATLASWFLFFNRTYALGEKDSVLLADFVNNTDEAVFDGALKQALAVQLEQTPFLNIFPEERVRETLRFMNRSPEEKLTRNVAREIGQRQGIKATLIGTIAKFDRHYAITLEAVNSQTGNTFALTLVEAQSKDDVLSALSKATKELRARLGESLGSIQRFAAPLEEGTTSSLEALKAVSLAREQFLKGNRIEAITLYKHAIELDAKFALPVARLANVYDGLGQSALATEFAEQAYQLRARTSEREKFLITSIYYDYVTGEIDKEVELLKLWTQTYPRDAFAHNALVTRYLMLGLFDQGVSEAKISIQLDPNYVFPPGNLAAGLVRLGRYDEANAAIAAARERKLDSTFYRFILYRTAFIQGNENLMQQQLDAAKGRPDEFGTLNWHSQALAFNGHLKESEAMAQRSITMAEQRHLDEVAAAMSIEATLRQILAGQKKADLNSLTKTLLHSRQSFTRGYRNPVLPPIGPLAFVLAGDLTRAQILMNETAQRNPKNVLTQAVWLPVAQAAIELERGQFAKAIELLEPAIPYESASVFWPTWLRAQAYLKMKKGAEAAAEFQKIIDHRGWEPSSMLYPLAHLGLARAASLQNNPAQSRSEYEKFFSMWKDADADLPVFIDAKKEFEQLR